MSPLSLLQCWLLWFHIVTRFTTNSYPISLLVDIIGCGMRLSCSIMLWRKLEQDQHQEDELLLLSIFDFKWRIVWHIIHPCYPCKEHFIHNIWFMSRSQLVIISRKLCQKENQPNGNRNRLWFFWPAYPESLNDCIFVFLV